MPKSRSSNTIASRSTGSGSGSGIGSVGGGGGGGIGGPIEEVEMAQRLEERLDDVRAVLVEMESRTRGGVEDVLVRFDPSTPGIATVTSESGNTYEVNYHDDECDCMHYRMRQNGCRHIDATHQAIGRVLEDRGTPNTQRGVSIGNESIEREISLRQEQDRREENARRALTRQMEDDGFFYSDNPEGFEATMARVAREPIPYQYENALNGNNVTFGIELEFVGGDSDAIARELYNQGICSHPTMVPYRSSSVPGKWKLERDGSVTSGRRGGELVSPILQDTPETWRNIETICEVAKRHGAIINYQCGGHVHVSMEPLNAARQRWRRFFKSVAGYEEAIYRFSGGTEGRIRSNYSSYAPSFANRAEVGATRRYQLNDTRDVHNMVNTVSQGNRYYGINLTNIPQSGRPNTVEFRYFNGSLDPAQIQANIKVATGVVMASEKARIKESQNEPTTETMRRRGRMINDATNTRDNNSIMKFVDTFFTRKEDKDQILGVFARNSWR